MGRIGDGSILGYFARVVTDKFRVQAQVDSGRLRAKNRVLGWFKRRLPNRRSHEKASLCQQKSSLAPSFFGGSRKGACPLAGGAAVFAAWGEPARPGFPLWGNGKGALKIPSLLPQAMNSVYSRSIIYFTSIYFTSPPPIRPASIRTLAGAKCSGASWGPQYFCSSAAI
jgi:hypothetical protein